MIWPILFLFSSLTFANPRSCLSNTYKLLTAYEKFPTKSLADGSDIVKIHVYIEAMSKKPKWRRFAEKIQEVRESYAPKMAKRRRDAKFDYRSKAPGYGYERMKRDAHNLPGKTVEEAFNKFNPGKDFYFIADGTKVIISPKNKILGEIYTEVLYDVSGNYFRLQKGRYTGYRTLTFLSEHQRYVDWDGVLINTENIRRPDQFQPLMHKTHWNAVID